LIAARQRPAILSRCIARAFTLLELLIVVVIIGILAALMFPAFAALRARAQRVQCTSNLRNLYLAAEVFLQHNGSWPQIRMRSEDDTAQRDCANAWRRCSWPRQPDHFHRWQH